MSDVIDRLKEIADDPEAFSKPSIQQACLWAIDEIKRLRPSDGETNDPAAEPDSAMPVASS